MNRERLETIEGMSRTQLLNLAARPGSAVLEGWSDQGRLTIVLPCPIECRTLDWSDLDEAGAFLRTILDEPALEEASDLDLPFAGGWVGFIAYEVGAEWERARRREDVPSEPAAWFARHEDGVVLMPDGKAHVFGDASRVWHCLDATGDARRSHSEPSENSAFVEDSMANGAYQSAVEEIRERIARGDVYQVNLTRRFTSEAGIDPVDLYLGMTGTKPPRCSAFLRGDGWVIASASPEVLLRFDPRRGSADSRPIKGTVRRTGDDRADENVLLGSSKDEAEHLMIVDLVRNDLGKVAPPGNVRVTEYKGLRMLEHVLHLESVVEASELGEGDLERLVHALFPGGSITGAPKRAAVHAIREIEPCARGVYTGAIGYVDRRGFAELSVAIRTAVIAGGKCRYHAGGGIVWDSDPEAEDRESFAKSIGFLEALGAKTT